MPVASRLLVEARGRAALSQSELARRAGMPRSVLNAYERGRREPGAEAMGRLLAAAGFGLDLTPLEPGVDDERPGRVLSMVIDLSESLPTPGGPGAGPSIQGDE